MLMVMIIQIEPKVIAQKRLMIEPIKICQPYVPSLKPSQWMYVWYKRKKDVLFVTWYL